MDFTWRHHRSLLPGLFLFSRIVLFLLFVGQSSNQFGDLFEYYGMASLTGWPFFGYWVEYPPVFPFLNEALYHFTGGGEIAFYFVFSMLLGLAGAGCIFLFQRIAIRIFGEVEGFIRAVIFMAIILPIPYTWWSYDLLPLFFLLAGIDLFFQGKGGLSGIAIGLGLLTKWFPGFLLPGLLRYYPGKVSTRVILISMAMLITVFGVLWLASPEMTEASLISQPNRTSWQTVWAYLDGNRVTGYFVYRDFRADPAQAYLSRGNPARIPTWLTLAVFALSGLYFFWRVRNRGEKSLIAFLGITSLLFFMWSPGWSPQWILYILPLILLTLPVKHGTIISFVLVFITMFEWPFALGQYWWRAVFAMVGLRMVTFALLIFLWYRITRRPDALGEG